MVKIRPEFGGFWGWDLYRDIPEACVAAIVTASINPLRNGRAAALSAINVHRCVPRGYY